MFLRFFFLFLFTTILLHAGNKKHLPLSDVEGGSICIVGGCVNVVTGDYVESSKDLVIHGPEPIVWERSYSSSDYDTNVLFHGWRHNYESNINVFEGTGDSPYAHYEETSGRTSFFNGTVSNDRVTSFVPELGQKGYTNIGSGTASGRTNPKNVRLVSNPFTHDITASEGNGDQKLFSHFGFYYLPLNETKANGNRIEYEYEKDLLVKVSTKNKKKNQTFGWIKLIDPPEYSGGGVFKLEANDGRKVSYRIKRFKIPNYSATYRLTEVSSPEMPTVSYEYKKKRTVLNFHISKKILPNNRFLQIGYIKSVHVPERDFYQIDRVEELAAPSGTNIAPISQYRFSYDEDDNGKGITSVYDSLNHLKKYHYDENKRINRIENFCGVDNQILYSTDKYIWNNDGELLARKLASGKGKVCVARALEYDSHGNIIKDTTYGDLTGNSPFIYFEKINDVKPSPNGVNSWVITYKYSNDGKNLLLEEKEQSGKRTCYGYYPGTDLLAWKFICDKDVICQRNFYKYDENAVLVSEIQDDGTSIHENDLKGITQRKIKRTKPQSIQPIGLPKEVEEYYLDIPTGKERLLHKTVNEFSSIGRLLNQKNYDSQGKYQYTLSWEYDDHGNMTLERNPLGDTLERKYNENNDLVFERNYRKDSSKKFTYDYMGRLIKTEEEHSDKVLHVTSRKYDVKGQLIAVVDPFGSTIHYEYDEFERLVATRYPEYKNHSGKHQPVSGQEYDIFGNVIASTDVMGRITSKTYNIRGQVTQIIYPDGTKESFRYREDGALKTSIAQNGLVTQYVHDCFGRLLTKEFYSPEGTLLSKTSATYNSFHKISETDSEGRITFYAYDGAGRLVTVTKGDGVTENTYDSWGRLETVKELLGFNQYKLKGFKYDGLSRVVEEKIEDEKGNLHSFVQYAYDVDGNKTQTLNSNGVTSTEYNSMKMPTRVVDALGNDKRYIYNFKALNTENQYVLEITEVDTQGIQTITQMNVLNKPALVLKKSAMGDILSKKELFYDLSGNLLQLVEDVIFKAETLQKITTKWTYNLNSKLLSLTEAADTTEQKYTEHHYNSYGQKSVIIKPDGVKILHEYDLLGRLQRFKSSDGLIHYYYYYNSNDELVAIDDLINNQSTIRQYDSNGRLIKEVLGNEYPIEYTYDSLGRPLSVSLADKSSVRYAYDPIRLHKVERCDSNGIVKYVHQYTNYDLSGNLLEMTMPSNAGNVQYGYDACERLTQINSKQYHETITYNTKGSIVSSQSTFTTQKYCYDDLSQLISESGDFNHTYENDSLYNCRFKDKQIQKFNSLNQLLSNSEESYTYDRKGNRTSHEGKKLIYDALDRLVEIHGLDTKILYVYDSFNRRLTKSVSTNNGEIQKTNYIYFGQNEVGSFNERGLIEFRALGVGKGAEIGATVSIELENILYIPISDHNGNIVALLNSDGTLAETYRYTAFGEEEKASELDNPWRFSSKRVDQETGFVNFGRRYYDPKTARWLTTDPIGFDGGPNLYTYLLNSPIDHFDLYGLLTLDYEGGPRHHLPRNAANGNHWFSRFMNTAAAMPGQILKIVGDHLVPIPIVREVVSYTASFIQGRTQSWKPSYSGHHSKELHAVGHGEVSPDLRMMGINGIMNMPDEILNRAAEMSATLGGQNVHFVYNNSFGFTTDILECIAQKLHIPTNSVNKAEASLKKHLADVGPHGTVILHVFSQGGLIAWEATQKLSSAERAQIEIISYGSPKLFPPEGYKAVRHYVGLGDPVPASDCFEYAKAIAFKSEHVILLPCKETFGIDHSWNSQTYREAFNYEAWKHIQQYGYVK